MRRHVCLFLEHVGAIHNSVASFMETIETTMNFLDTICSVTGYSKVWCGKLALNLCRLTRRLYTISEARSEVDRPLVATVWDDGNKVDVQSHDGSLDRLHILIGFFS